MFHLRLIILCHSAAIANLNEEDLQDEMIASDYIAAQQNTGDEDEPLNDDKATEEIKPTSVISLLGKQSTTADQRPRNRITDRDTRRRDDCLPGTVPTLLPDKSHINESSSVEDYKRILSQQEQIPSMRNKDSRSADVRNHVTEDKGHNSDENKQGQARRTSVDKYDDMQRHMSQRDVIITQSDPPGKLHAKSPIEVLPPRSVNNDQLAAKSREILHQSTKLKTRHIKNTVDINTGTFSTGGSTKDKMGDRSGKI